MANVDPKFVRSAKAEADAMRAGITKEYIESRGGVNSSGYYGDSWSSSKNLTPEEYDAVIKGGLARGLSGAAIGGAINSATEAKASGGTVNIQTGQWSGGTRSTGGGGGGGGGGSSLTTGSGSSAPTASYTATDGTKFTDQAVFTNYQKMLNENTAIKEKDLTTRRSAFQIIKEEFDRYGIGKLVGDVERLLVEGTPPAEYSFQLRQTPTYKQRFAANEQRIKKGLRALDESSYIALEDQYQDVMRRYGLPEAYYQRDDIGTQKAFEKLIAADVSNVELEKRIQNTQSRIFDANPEVMAAMRQFYPDITGGEILAYALDPETALPQLERKIAAAEIGGAALQAGLTTGLGRAEQLAAAGVTKAAAQEQYGKIASGLERGKRLSEIYQQPTYTQEIAEAEAFALSDAEKARRQRRKLTQLETAEFGGTTGMTGGALSRERAGQY
jgi:hypothetical protein